jgi:hypothetical protein
LTRKLFANVSLTIPLGELLGELVALLGEVSDVLSYCGDFGDFGVFGSTGVVRVYRERRCVFLEVHDILTELRDLGSGIFKGVLCGGTLLGLLIC